MTFFRLLKRKPKPVTRLNGREIVRLKKDYPDDDLKAGDCGLVWGVYDTNPPFYETSFFASNGDKPDVIFEDCEIDAAIDIIDVQQITPAEVREYFTNWLKELDEWDIKQKKKK